MSATQAALDELDDATLETVIALQLIDLADILYGDDDDDSAASDVAAVGQAFSEELLQYYAVRRYESEETQLAEASAVAAVGGPTNIQCASCDDQFSTEKVWKALCGHHYCVPCLEFLHEACMTDETLYPPRCCQRGMPWNDVKAKINGELATSFDKSRKSSTRLSASVPTVSMPNAPRSSELRTSQTTSPPVSHARRLPAPCARRPRTTTVTVLLTKLWIRH